MTALPDYAALGFQDVLVAFQDSIVIITINRPKQRNAINGSLMNELNQLFELCDRDDRVRAVILTADPKHAAYCSGADISGGWDRLWDKEAEKEGAHAHRDSGGTLAMSIYKCRKITIAAVNGHAAGAGCTAFQLPFDIRFAWKGAKITFPFVRRGITPEATSTYLLPRLIGHSRASALLLTGQTLSPDSPLIRDLYSEIIDQREDVLPRALAFARELAANTSQVSVAYTKALLQHPGNSIEENHLLDSATIRLLGQRPDATEGVRSFLERRDPKFTDTLSKIPWQPWWRSLEITHRKSKL